MSSRPGPSRGKAPMIVSSDEEQVPVYSPTYYPGCPTPLPQDPTPALADAVAPREATPEQAYAVVPALPDVAGPSAVPTAALDPAPRPTQRSRPLIRTTARKAVNVRAQVVQCPAPRPSDFDATDPTEPTWRSDSPPRRSRSPPRRQLTPPRRSASQEGSHSVSMPAPQTASPPVAPPQAQAPAPAPDRLLMYLRRRVLRLQTAIRDRDTLISRRAVAHRRTHRLLDLWRAAAHHISMEMTDAMTDLALAVGYYCAIPDPTPADRDALLLDVVERVEVACESARRTLEDADSDLLY